MKLVWLDAAESDIEEIFDYIVADNPEAALRVFETVRYSVSQLAVHPNLGRVGRVSRTRELVIRSLPYIVVYYLTDDEVRILGVLHTSQRWPDSFPM